MFRAAPFIETYERASCAATRRKLYDAMWMLMSDGTSDDQAAAATFFAKIDIPGELVERAANLCLSAGLEASPD